MLWLSDSVEVFMCSLMLFYFVLTIFSFTMRPFVGQQKNRHFFSERFVTLNLTNSSVAQTKLVKPGVRWLMMWTNMRDLKLCLDIREVLETGSINCYLMRKEGGGSGTNPEPFSEAETMLEEIKLYQQQIVSKDWLGFSNGQGRWTAEKNERRKTYGRKRCSYGYMGKVQICRWLWWGRECKGETRKEEKKGGSNALKFLGARCQANAEVKKEGVALR